MIDEFKKFIARGNVLDMAIGIIVGVSFGAIIKSLVDDIMMPPIGLLLGKVDFSNLFLVLKDGKVAGPYLTVADAHKVGAVTLNYGVFGNALLNFMIIVVVVFMVLHVANRMAPRPETAPTNRNCQFCDELVSLKASRCPHCSKDFQ